MEDPIDNPEIFNKYAPVRDFRAAETEVYHAYIDFASSRKSVEVARRLEGIIAVNTRHLSN